MQKKLKRIRHIIHGKLCSFWLLHFSREPSTLRKLLLIPVGFVLNIVNEGNWSADVVVDGKLRAKIGCTDDDEISRRLLFFQNCVACWTWYMKWNCHKKITNQPIPGEVNNSLMFEAAYGRPNISSFLILPLFHLVADSNPAHLIKYILWKPIWSNSN